jgi:hypothetical protein
VVQRFYVDGSQDDVIRTSFEGPGGASRTEVIGEHTNAGGIVTERDRHADTMVSRVDQGLEPLGVTEISRERFDETSGLPRGEQYHAVATSDSTLTTLEEQRDYYTADGVIYDTKIESTQMSRTYDEGLVDDFLAANAAQIDRAHRDDLDVNDDGTSITVPPAGSFYAHSSTDIDYDADGVAIHQVVEEETVTVGESDSFDGEDSSGSNNGNGVRVTSTSTTRTTGSPDGTVPIFDEDGARIADERVTTTISTSEFDPDAGRAGGNNGDGFQYRETTEVTIGVTNRADGSTTDEWATPFTVQVLREGHDDDWIYEETIFRTNERGELVNGDGQPLGEGDEPAKLGRGDEAYNAAGERITLERDGVKNESLDFADNFESFMEGWGGKIIGAAGVVAGVALIATGIGSPLGVALAVGGVALASTQFAYVALNHSQGEASDFDLLLAGAGVALSVVPAFTGVRQLANAGRAANLARSGAGALNASDDIVRTTASRVAMRSYTTVGTGMDAIDGYDAARAALRGDFYGAALMLGAIGGGVAVGRVRGGGATGPDVADLSPGTPDVPDVPTIPDVPTVGTRGDGSPLPGPATADGALPVRTPDTAPAAGAQPLPGTSTGPDAGAPRGVQPDAGVTPGAQPETSVAGTSGDGMPAPTAGPAAAAAGTGQLQLPDAPRPTEPTAPRFPDDVVADPRATGIDAAAAWGGSERYTGHVDRHLAQYDAARYEAAGLEVPTTADGRRVTDAATYHQRALDYREMAITGRLEDGVTAHPRANGGMMLVNARTNEVAFINADGTIGSLIPVYRVKSRADGSYRRDGNQENMLSRYVEKELGSDALVYAVRRAQQDGDPIAMQQSLDALRELNPNRYDAMARELGLDAPGATDGASATPGYGRDTQRTDGVRLEPPIPRELDVRGGLTLANPVLDTPSLQGLFDARLGSSDGFGGVGRGIGSDGRVIVDVPTMRRDTSVDNLIAANPEVVARLGGPDAVRANPSLLDGQTLRVRRSSGEVEAGWTVDGGVNADGTLNMARFERRSMDIGEFLVRRQQSDASFDGRAALHDLIADNPQLLHDRPLRLRRSDHSIAEGRAAHNIDDGWQVVGSRRGENGSIELTMVKEYRFDDLPPAAQAQAREQGYRPGDTVIQQRNRVPLDDVLDYNRARLEGDHGQVPRVVARLGTPDGMLLGVDRALLPGDATGRADQAVVHTQAALDYLYSRHGYVPTGGDITLVIDADGTFRNASMSSRDNVLRIGVHPEGGGAFDPSVIMHELGHKMVDDFTAGHYGNTQAGAIHEGFADVMAAGWTHDPIVGRVFDQQGRQGIRDIRTGEQLIGTRAEWEAASQTRDGAGAHAGSGVVTGVASRMVGDPAAGGMTWGEVGDLYNDALRTGGMRRQMDFDSFSDALRIATANRYGIDSPQYRTVLASLDQGGLAPRIETGARVSRITSRGEVAHGFDVLGTTPDGRVILRGPDGDIIVPRTGILTGGGRNVTVDAAGRTIPVDPASASNGGRSLEEAPRMAAPEQPGAAATGTPLPPPMPPLPTRDLPASSVGRVLGTDGQPAVVYGRLPDGRLIMGDGSGTRYAAGAVQTVLGNLRSFSTRAMQAGETVSLRRPDGSFDDAAQVVAHNADGTVVVRSGDQQVLLDVDVLAGDNLHRLVAPGTVARVDMGNGVMSDGWQAYGTRNDVVYLQRTNVDGSIDRTTIGSLAFLQANSDRILGSFGAYPGQPLRRGLGGEFDMPDTSVVEGQHFRRVGAGELSQAGGYLFRGGIEVQHGDVLIRVETDLGTPSMDVRHQVQLTMTALDALPPEMRRNITEVNVLEGRNPGDAHWAQVTGNEHFLSGATAGTNNINLFYGHRGNTMQLLAHEATHTFGVNGGPFHRDLWEQQMLLDAAHLSTLAGRGRIRPLVDGLQLDTPAVSGYAQLHYDGMTDPTGRRNVNEDWAETGAFIVRGEHNGGSVATRRRWWGGVQRLTMADLFPNRTRTFNDYRGWAQQQMNGGAQPGQPVAAQPQPGASSSSTGNAYPLAPPFISVAPGTHGAMAVERVLDDEDERDRRS